MGQGHSEGTGCPRRWEMQELGKANLTDVTDAAVDSCMYKDLICEDWIGKIKNKIEEDHR